MKTIYSLALLILLSASLSFGAVRGPYQRLIVFGDSLSDVGTYSKVAVPRGGGKFTTNPGPLWIDGVALSLGLPMAPNRYEGFGFPTELVGGFNYAQGGARVTLEQPKSGQNNISARPLVVQTQYFLQQYHLFLATDLVIVQGGSNDIFAQIQGLKEGKVTPIEAINNMATAGLQMMNIVRSIKAAGAKDIFVINLPMIQTTPMALSMNTQQQGLIQQMVQAFNSQLVTTRAGVALIDIYNFEMSMTNNYSKFGIKDITHPACQITSLPGQSSLYCNVSTLVEVGADQTYKYADIVHPTTAYHALVGKFVVAEIMRKLRISHLD